MFKNLASYFGLSEVKVNEMTFKSYDDSKLFLNADIPNFTLITNDKSKVELNLKSVKTAIDLSKSAYVKALISSSEMRFDLYQKSSAEVEGDVIELKLRLDNNTDFIGRKLTAKNASLETAGYSKSSINISNIATVDASGNSEIQLYGEPLKIEMKRFADSAELRKKPTTK